MKKTLLMAGLCFCFSTGLYAQWEQVGWEGGYLQLQYQLGNTIFGVSQCGLYKSTDCGHTWHLFRDSLPLSTFLVHSNTLLDNDAILYSHSAQVFHPPYFPIGIYYATENSEHWNYISCPSIPLVSTSSYTAFYSRVLDKDTCFFFFGYEYIWGTDTLQGLYLSTNGGKTFEIDVSQPLENMQEPSLYVEHVGNKLFKYIEGIDTIQRSYIKAEFWSDDLGNTWHRTNLPFADTVLFQTFYLSDSLRFIQTQDTNSSSMSLLFRSSDAGTTWTQLSDPVPTTLHKWSINFLEKRGKSIYLNQNIYINSGFKPKEYYLLRSTDEGVHWKRIMLADTSIHRLSDVFGTDTSLIFCDDIKYFNGNYRTDTSFLTISTFSPENIYGGYFTLLYSHENDLYAYPFGALTALIDSVYISTDNGLSWSLTPYSPRFFAYQSRWVSNGKFLFSLASKDRNKKNITVLRSSDDGNNWAPVLSLTLEPNDPPAIIADDSIIVLNTNRNSDGAHYRRDSSVFYSSDNGNTWTLVAGPAVDPTDPFIVSSYGGTLFYHNSYYSDAIGKWWGEVKLPTTTNIVNPLFGYGGNWFISATEKDSQFYFVRHYRSSDKGQNWNDVKGLPSDMKIFYGTTEKGILYVVATALEDMPEQFGGCKLFYSVDSGLTWSQIPGNVMNATNLFSGSEYFFLAGDQELWRLPKSLASVRTGEPKYQTSIAITSAYPNPAHDEIRISYSLPRRSEAQLSVYDLTGKLVATLTQGEANPGSYEVKWETRGIANGMYIIELSALGEKATQAVQVVK